MLFPPPPRPIQQLDGYLEHLSVAPQALDVSRGQPMGRLRISFYSGVSPGKQASATLPTKTSSFSLPLAPRAPPRCFFSFSQHSLNTRASVVGAVAVPGSVWCDPRSSLQHGTCTFSVLPSPTRASTIPSAVVVYLFLGLLSVLDLLPPRFQPNKAKK